MRRRQEEEDRLRKERAAEAAALAAAAEQEEQERKTKEEENAQKQAETEARAAAMAAAVAKEEDARRSRDEEKEADRAAEETAQNKAQVSLCSCGCGCVRVYGCGYFLCALMRLVWSVKNIAGALTGKDVQILGYKAAQQERRMVLEQQLEKLVEIELYDEAAEVQEQVSQMHSNVCYNAAPFVLLSIFPIFFFLLISFSLRVFRCTTIRHVSESNPSVPFDSFYILYSWVKWSDL
jgi:protein-arginine kinase activator protein McsA